MHRAVLQQFAGIINNVPWHWRWLVIFTLTVGHANMKGLGLTPWFGDRRGFMPPQSKTKKLRPVCNQWQPGTTTVPSTSALGRFLWAMVAANYGAPGCTAGIINERRTNALALADDIHLDGRPCCTTSRGRRSGHPGGGAGAGAHCDAYRRYGGGSPGL